MRRFALVALFALAFAPVAHAGCGVTTTALAGKAPLAVTFTAQCASASYTWDFGDGSTATGQAVQHVFSAGAFHPTLGSDAGSEATAAVTSISLRVTAPRRAKYASYVALHATVVPRVPVTFRGRTFVHGKLRVRVLRAAPWTVHAGPVTAATATLVVPTLTLATRGVPLVGEPVRVVATLHPASAGRVVAPRSVDTGSARVVRVHATSKPTRGWTRASATLAVAIVQPALARGSSGASVRALEDRLADLHYAVVRDGAFGQDDTDALLAFQKVEGLARTGVATADVWRRLLAARTPQARYGGDHVEVDKGRQVIFVVRDGQVTLVVATSTGATGNTPLGIWHVYRKVAGFDWVLYYPSYFLRGFAVHGYPDVPAYPASHGCARIPMWIATTVYAQMPPGSTVYVYA
jgi:L,D-transpeptidase catalytic domain/Putative peptidoglycan binding domain/PKD domain